MKKEDYHQLLENLGNVDCASFRLRNMFCGGILDIHVLGGTKFVKTETNEEYQCWEYYWNRKKNKCVLVLDNNGVICNIALLIWLDLQADDYIGAGYAYGWYYTQSCSKQMENKLVDEIGSCLGKPINKRTGRVLAQIVKNYDLRHFPESADFDDAYLVCAHANYLWERNPAKARLLSSVMVRHLKKISNPLVQHDLPFLCGRLGLYPECVYTIRHLFHNYKELSAKCLSSMGAVSTDNLREHQFALYCFLESIKLDPALQPPRQGIWHAGRRCMHEHFVEKDFLAAVNVAEKVVAVGGHEYAPHGFYSYLGLAFEMLNRKEDALRAFETALTISPDCQVSEQGYRRTKGISTTFWTAPIQVQLLIERAAYNDYASENRYPWC